MKNTLFIAIIILALFSCNHSNQDQDTTIEKESILEEITYENINTEPIQEKTINSSTPNGKLLYSMNQLFIYENKAFLKGEVLYDGEEKLAQLIQQEATEDCPVNYEFRYNPLSLIGNYYSYELSESGDYACGSPGSSHSIQSIDISTENPIKITDLFTETSIIPALKQDGWVIKNASADIDLNDIKTFDELLKAINNSDSATFEASSFAILGYDKEKNLAAVRLIGSSYMGFNHSEYLQLGLLIEPNKKMEKLLKEKAFFYLGKFNNGVKG